MMNKIFFLSLIFILIISNITFGQYSSSTDTYTLQDGDVTVENGVITLCKTTVTDWGTGNLKIPDTLQGQEITAIAGIIQRNIYTDGVFDGRRVGKITSVLFPISLDSIGAYAFAQNEIVDLALPDHIKYLGQGAFYKSGYLQTLTISSQIDTIRQSTFDYARIKTVTIPKSVVCMTGLGGFYNCDSLKTVVFEEGCQLNYIGECVFWYCDILNIILPCPIKEGNTFIKWIDKNGNTVTEFNESDNSSTNSTYYKAIFTPTIGLRTVSGKIFIDNTMDVIISYSGSISGNIDLNQDSTFSIAVEAGQNIIITPSKAGYTFIPESKTISNIQSDIDSINFTANLTTDIKVINNYEISVFPNPTNGEICIESGKLITQIALFDNIGNKVLYQEVNSKNALLDIKHLPKGIYLIVIYAGNKKLSEKIIKK